MFEKTELGSCSLVGFIGRPTKSALESFLKLFDEVVEVVIMKDHTTGRACGFPEGGHRRIDSTKLKRKQKCFISQPLDRITRPKQQHLFLRDEKQIQRRRLLSSAADFNDLLLLELSRDVVFSETFSEGIGPTWCSSMKPKGRNMILSPWSGIGIYTG